MNEFDRLSKIISNSGICSRRQAEEYILAGRVEVDNKIIKDVTKKFKHDSCVIKIDNTIIKTTIKARIWSYYKPRGVITSHMDNYSRKTVFDNIRQKLPYVISVGRLDFNSEGLLLLTNNGMWSYNLSLPKNNIIRVYKVRVYGILNSSKINKLENGGMFNNNSYNKGDIKFIFAKATNAWFEVTLFRGRNREIRKLFEEFNLIVNRLIRIQYSKFLLGNLKPNQYVEHEINSLKGFYD